MYVLSDFWDSICITVTKEGKPFVILTSQQDIDKAKAIAGTIWNGFSYNSHDGPEHYKIIIDIANHKKKYIEITPDDWHIHGKTPDKFISFLKQKNAEQTDALNSDSATAKSE